MCKIKQKSSHWGFYIQMNHYCWRSMDASERTLPYTYITYIMHHYIQGQEVGLNECKQLFIKDSIITTVMNWLMNFHLTCQPQKQKLFYSTELMIRIQWLCQGQSDWTGFVFCFLKNWLIIYGYILTMNRVLNYCNRQDVNSYAGEEMLLSPIIAALLIRRWRWVSLMSGLVGLELFALCQNKMRLVLYRDYTPF